MTAYTRNKLCHCQRCRSGHLVGASALVTVGILFLLQNFDVVSWDRSWPALLIVIGVILFVAHNASTEGHIQPYWAGGPPPAKASQNPDQEVKP